MPPPPPAIYIGLHGGDPGVSGLLNDVTIGIANGRGAISVSDWREPVKVENEETISYVISNAATVLLAESAGGTVPVSHFSCWDSARGGNFLGYGVIADPLTIVTGDPVRFSPGALRIRALTPKGASEGLPPPLPPIETGEAIAFVGAPNTRLLYNSPYVLGYRYRTQHDRTLVGLGIFKPNGQQTIDDHSVGIWNFADPWAPELVWSRNFYTTEPFQDSEHFCWYDVADGPVLNEYVDYIVATTWGDEPSPHQIDEADIALLLSGSYLNQTAQTFSGDVPSMIVDLSNPDYTPTTNYLSDQKGFITVNMRLRRELT